MAKVTCGVPCGRCCFSSC